MKKAVGEVLLLRVHESITNADATIRESMVIEW